MSFNAGMRQLHCLFNSQQWKNVVFERLFPAIKAKKDVVRKLNNASFLLCKNYIVGLNIERFTGLKWQFRFFDTPYVYYTHVQNGRNGRTKELYFNIECTGCRTHNIPGHMEINHDFDTQRNYYTKHREVQE